MYYLREDIDAIQEYLRRCNISFEKFPLDDIDILGYCKKSKYPKSLRKVIFIPDKGIKERPITEADPLSQSMLKHLHDIGYQILSILNHD
jgi:hypothetical protein